MKNTLASVLLSLPSIAIADAGSFDRSRLGGVWSESYDTGKACRADQPHVTFDLSKDGKTLTFNLDRTIKRASGEEVSTYSATVTRGTKASLFIEYNHAVNPKVPKRWEMAFVAPGIYRWRATEWDPGRVNIVVGLRCSE
jgi:hypothetical protein